MVRVAHLISSFRLPDGPSSAILAQIAFGDRARFEHSVWSMYGAPPDRDATGVLTEAKVPHRCLEMGASFLDVRVLPRLVSMLRRERPDVLHAHLVRANLYGRIAARLAGVPVVINTIRNVESYMLSDGVVDGLVRAFERATSPMVDAYTAVSDRVRAAAIAHLRLRDDRITTILNAVDPTRLMRIQQRAADGEVVIGTAGALDPRKNHDMLVRAVARMREGGAPVRLLIAGEGEERQRLQSTVRSLGLDDAVTLCGLVYDMPAFLASVDLFAMTSIHEGLPRAVMEAMAAGRPVVATDAGGTAEAVVPGENGFVVHVNDLDSLTDALARLVNDAELRRSMGEASRRRAATVFDPRRMAAEYEELYDHLVSR